jgi:hypothetical protein
MASANALEYCGGAGGGVDAVTALQPEAQAKLTVRPHTRERLRPSIEVTERGLWPCASIGSVDVPAPALALHAGVGRDRRRPTQRLLVVAPSRQQVWLSQIELGKRKREVAESALGRDAGAGKRLTQDDIEDLLRTPAVNPWDNV